MTATALRMTAVSVDVPGLDIPPLTVAAPCIGAVVRAILHHVRPHLPGDRPVFVAINPDGRGHLWDGRYIIGTLRLTGGVR